MAGKGKGFSGGVAVVRVVKGGCDRDWDWSDGYCGCAVKVIRTGGRGGDSGWLCDGNSVRVCGGNSEGDRDGNQS